MILGNDLELFITDKLSSINENVELCVILDAAYVVEQHRTVYASMCYDNATKKRSLVFFYKNKENKRIHITSQILSYLLGKLNSLYFDGISLPEISFGLTRDTVKVDLDLGLLIIESAVYKLGRTAMSYSDVNHIASYNGIELSAQTLNQIRAKFKEISYGNYLKLIYSVLQRRFIPRIYRRNSFYKIQRAFVPVFVQYDFVYEPLLGDKTDLTFINSEIYQTAVQKNRVVEVNSHLRCYMLTHKEICEALHMKYFMRFTPDFLYKLLVGLGNYNLEGFPSKTTRVYLAPIDEDRNRGLKRIYTESEYNQELASLADTSLKMKDLGKEEEALQLESSFIALQHYREANTLRYHCEINFNKLTSFGSKDLDNRVTVDQLFSYLNDAIL